MESWDCMVYWPKTISTYNLDNGGRVQRGRRNDHQPGVQDLEERVARLLRLPAAALPRLAQFHLPMAARHRKPREPHQFLRTHRFQQPRTRTLTTPESED